jgi:hypothetical protein
MNKLYTLLTIIVFTITACKSASKAYDHGNYTDAIEIAVKKLQKDPYDAKMKSVLQNAYKFAVNKHEEQIHSLLASNTENRYEAVYQQYYLLQKLYENIQESPAAAQAVKPTNYSSFLRTYQDKSAETYYERGLALMQTKDEADERRPFKEAYYQFINALRFKPNDVEITNKLKEAKEAATINILIMPLDSYGGYRYTSNSQMQNFQNELVRTIRYGINNEFVNFMTDLDASRKNVQPDEVIEMRLGNFNLGKPYEQSQTNEVSKDVVTKETVYRPDSVVKQYTKVFARVITTQRTLVSDADLYINIRDLKGKSMLSENLRGEHKWTTEITTYTGDERALSDGDKTSLSRQPKNQPKDEEVVQEILKQLQRNVTARLRDYYRSYN